MREIEQLTAPLCEHGEGIATSARWAGPRWVDMLAGDLLQLDPSGGVRRRHVGDIAAMTRPCVDAGWMVALERSIAFTASDDFDAMLTEGAELWGDPAVRANEGACAPDGRLYLGTMEYDAAPDRGFVLELTSVDEGRTVIEPVTISNGLAFTADGRTAFYTDSTLRRIDRFDWSPDTGLANRTPWAHLPESVEGIPDGLAVDADGGVWVAVFGGGAIWRFDASGAGEQAIALPVKQPTAVAFDGDTLLISTSRYAMGHAAEKGAGALFAARVGVTGAPVAEFRL